MREQTTRPLLKGDQIPAIRISDTRDEADESWTIFDFGASYPLGEIRLNSGRPAEESCPVRIEYSLNGKDWAPAGTPGISEQTGIGGNAQARYVRIEGAKGDSASFYVGTGLAVEPADDWTLLFHRSSGWTGSDGIYSIPLNGVEDQGRSGEGRTLLLFGDTFIGSVDKETDARISPVMINNSFAILQGDRPNPERISFHWGRQGDEHASAIVPTTPDGLAHEGTYYWLQDGTSVGGRFHCFPLIVGPNPEGPEGFEFEVHGIARVSAPMGENGPVLEEQEQADTPLYSRTAEGLTTYFGAAIMPNTVAAGVPNPDGFVYVYGLRNDGATRMVASRVREEELADTTRWTFWNGRDWTDNMEDCVPIAPDTSTEFSVTPMTGGFLEGKYVAVFQQGGIHGSHVAIYLGESPVGPFGPATFLYYCAEPEEGKGIYTYNAKAHPHLSPPGELLVSYNVNTTSWDAHKAFGSIYRPRFIRIRQIV